MNTEEDDEMLVRQQTETRPEYMLRVAAAYIRKHWLDGEIQYDGTTCDGYCVADDCDAALEELQRQRNQD